MIRSKELQNAIDLRKVMKRELRDLKADSYRLRCLIRHFSTEPMKEEREAERSINKRIKKKIRAMGSIQNLINQEFKRLGRTDANMP